MKVVYFRQPPAFDHQHKQRIIDAINDEIANAPAHRWQATFDQVRARLESQHSIPPTELPDGVLEQIFIDMGLEVHED